MKIKYLKFSLVFIMSGVFVLGIQGQPAAQQQPNAAGDKGKPKYAQGRLIVKFKSDGPNALNEDAGYLLEGNQKFQASVSDGSDSLDKLYKKHRVKKAKNPFMDRHGLSGRDAREKQERGQRFSRAMHQSRSQRAPRDAAFPDLSNVYVLEVPPESDIEAVVQEFQADPHVEYAQPDYLMKANMVPNDPYYSSYGSWGQSYDDLWGLKKMQAAQAWDLAQGEGVVVAVVDTGVDYNHPDIAANIWTNIGEIPNNGMDDDGNGFVDDIRGWDFGNSDNDPGDVHGHGTHVSGTIAAVGNNGIGMIGVAPKVKIMPVKGFMDSGGAWSSDLAKGIKYAVYNGADVVNNSWGCETPCPSNPFAEDAVRTAYNLGAMVVFAAGNDNADVADYSPQNMTETIAVAASNYLDQRASFSNYGPLIDITAPGVGILSLRVNSTGYSVYSGTSMAAPHVSGLVALLLDSDPMLDQLQIKQRLYDSADDLGAAGFDPLFGFGRINAIKTLTGANNGNQAPVLSPVGNKNVTVGQLLSFNVSAIDQDGDALTYYNNPVISGSNFANQTYNWTPTSSQVGTYNVTFTVSDGILTDTETIAITVKAPVQPARITTPTPGSQITTSSVTFGWSANPASTQYYLWVGTAPNTNNLRNLNAGTSTSLTTTVPLDGTLLYVSIWSKVNNVWVKDHEVSYTRSTLAASPARITTPVPGSQITTSSVTFGWSANPASTQYYLWVGTAPNTNNLRNLNAGTSTSLTTTVPLDGTLLYVSIWSKVNNVWVKDHEVSYTRSTLAASPARITTPVPGSQITTSSVTFGWSANPASTQYYLWVGTAPNTNNLRNLNAGTSTSITTTVTLDGNPLYVSIWSKINNVWVKDHEVSYTRSTLAASPARITTPVPGSQITTSSVTFGWSANPASTQYYLWVGTAPNTNNLRNLNAGTSTSITTTVPLDGTLLYVSIWSKVNNVWVKDHEVSYTRGR